MINIVIPMLGNNKFENNVEYQYPKPIIDINNKPLIERSLDSLRMIPGEKRFIFIVNTADCQLYSLDNILRLVAEPTSEIIRLEKETGGAVCSTLMSIDYIDNNDPLIVVNSDQIIDYNLDKIMNDFVNRDLDAGVICFDSVYPKWSYIRIDDDDTVIETSEKRPISRNAIAGFYYFKKGGLFVSSAMRTIERDASIDGQYYLSSTLNELILDGRKIGYYRIPNSDYYNFHSPQILKEYEKKLVR